MYNQQQHKQHNRSRYNDFKLLLLKINESRDECPWTTLGRNRSWLFELLHRDTMPAALAGPGNIKQWQ